MYQGLDPRTRPLRWLLFGAAVAIVLLGTGPTALDTASTWLRDEYERLPWYTIRVTALLSYLALTASVVYGLLLSTRLLDRMAHRAVSFTLHQDLGSIGLALALVHAAVLMIDRSVPFTPAELLVPFSGPYRPLWVGVGQLALVVTIIVVVSFYLRKRTGQKTWRRIHYLSFLAFLGATIRTASWQAQTARPHGPPWATWSRSRSSCSCSPIGCCWQPWSGAPRLERVQGWSEWSRAQSRLGVPPAPTLLLP